jgi:diguanylate cyclase (GGDEF)-like protein
MLTAPDGAAAGHEAARLNVLEGPHAPGVLELAPAGRPVPKVWALTALLAGLAIFLYLQVVQHLAPIATPIPVPWPAVALLFCLGELLDVQVHFRRETHAFSLSEFPTVIGLFFLEPTTYLVALLVGSGVALAIQSRGHHPVKIAFNLADVALNGTIALTIFHSFVVVIEPSLSATVTPGPGSWFAAGAATLTTSIVAAVAIAAAISLSGGAPQFQKLPDMIQFGGLVALANTSLALLAVSILWIHSASIWLLIVPVATLFIAYRAYVSEREKHERLELLYESSRILQNSPQLDSALVALLEHAREMFRAELAEILLYPRSETGDGLRTRSTHEGDPEVMVPIALAAADPIRTRIVHDGSAFLHVPARGWRVRSPEIRQAMTCSLVGERGLIGEMTVANRMTQGTSFLGDDLRLLEMVASQAAAALENGQLEQSLTELSRLKEQLRHQAYHDSLTGLPNRALFTEQVEARLAHAAGGSPLTPVVLFLDLDDFKIVNDTLGHAAGDRLLVLVAERVAGCIRAGDLAARLGGDEFAILLEDRPDLERAMGVANRVIDALQAPFQIQGKEVVVGGSIGIAVPRDTEERAHDLLRKADMAMYTAKSDGKRRVSVFDPNVHASIVARHELSAELAGSIARAELAVHYQPVVDLGTLQMVGVEALVRWNHPVHGLVPPDAFVRLAEENGTILELGRWVVVEACDQVMQWKRAGILRHPVALCLNLSPIQLQEPNFVQDMDGILLRTGFDPNELVVEMTETAMFRDSQATIARLEELRGRGMRIAVDDFGTGYSSLGYLRRFPVDILKIARDFVVPASSQPEEWAFAHAIVALGRTLGLTIIAEGIEEPGQLARLRELGCQLGQGFLLGRPVPPDELEALLRANAAAADAIEAAEKAGNVRVGWPQLPEPVELARVRA